MEIQPLYIIPVLIKQPTWGGSYIQTAKGLHDDALVDTKVGQAYELYSESRVSPDPEVQDAFVLTDSSLVSQEQIGLFGTSIDLASLINLNPHQILGDTQAQEEYDSMPLLIKFTQARANSYQVHVRPGSEFHGWQSKPESWYFLESGKATLGIKHGVDLGVYRRRCLEIEAESLRLSRLVLEGELQVAQAQSLLNTFIEENHPSNYVNTVKIPANSMVDLSQGGIHHSWEYDESTPQGNIVYEVQLDVKDERCTIRAFDHGNFKENGELRPLSISDYFEALNSSPLDNHIDHLITQPLGEESNGIRSTILCQNDHYSLVRHQWQESASHTMQFQSFRHLFVVSGELTIHFKDKEYPVKTGRSVFLPAACGECTLTGSTNTVVLQTSTNLLP